MEIAFEEQLKSLTALDEYVEKRIAKRLESIPEEKYRSDEINELAADFAKAQSEYPIITYNRATSIFNNEYTDLDRIMFPTRPILGKYGLVFFQHRSSNDTDGIIYINSLLFHSSGQWIRSKARVIPSSQDKTVILSDINTTKRIEAQTLLNVTVKDDLLDDEDVANKEYDTQQAQGVDLNYKYNPKASVLRITKSELEDVQYELKELPDIAAHLLQRLKIETFADMPKDQYHKVIDYIRKVAKERHTPKKV